jgi:single-strand DNA-binding protein
MMEVIKNSVRLTGMAGTDPVIVNFPTNKRIARVSLAVHEFYKNTSGEQVNHTQWFNLVFWNKKVELVENIVKKGCLITIEGKLNIQSYTDKKGEQRFNTEIVVNNLELVIN